MKYKVMIHDTPGVALTLQKSIDGSNLPFTLNTCIGCLTGCRYCYLQQAPFKWHSVFGEEVKVKTWISDRLDKELERHKDLPQHLKRVQVNPATEGYLPQVIRVMREDHGRDVMGEVLAVFRKHWNAGNKWMVHLVTKSHRVLDHLDLISDMKDQVQLELTITSTDEAVVRKLEGYAPLASKRIEMVTTFADRGVFVRVMCMPFIGDEQEAALLLQGCFQPAGASGFKHKSTNYWSEAKLSEGELVSSGGKRDIIFTDLLWNSGEPVLEGAGKPRMVTASMPDGTVSKLTKRAVPVLDFGYRYLNDVDWVTAV